MARALNEAKGEQYAEERAVFRSAAFSREARLHVFIQRAYTSAQQYRLHVNRAGGHEIAIAG
jgi:hypothetical protein